MIVHIVGQAHDVLTTQAMCLNILNRFHLLCRFAGQGFPSHVSLISPRIARLDPHFVRLDPLFVGLDPPFVRTDRRVWSLGGARS